MKAILVFAVFQISFLTLAFLQTAVSEELFRRLIDGAEISTFFPLVSDVTNSPKYSDDKFDDEPKDVFNKARNEMEAQAIISSKNIKEMLDSAVRDIKYLTGKYMEEFLEYTGNSMSEIIKRLNSGDEPVVKVQAKQDVADLTSDYNNTVDVVGFNFEESLNEISNDLGRNIKHIAEEYKSILSKNPFSRNFNLNRKLKTFDKKIFKFAKKNLSNLDKLITISRKNYTDFETDTVNLINSIAYNVDKLLEYAGEKYKEGYNKVCLEIKDMFGKLKIPGEEIDKKIDDLCNKNNEIVEEYKWDEEYRK